MENNTNHTGFETYDAVWILTFCAVISIGVYLAKKVRFSVVPVVANILAIIIYLFVDYFNIMVQYDRWCRRGMPDAFEIAHERESDLPSEIQERYFMLMDEVEKGKITRQEYNRKTYLLGEEVDKLKIIKFEKLKEKNKEKLDKGKITREKFHYETALLNNDIETLKFRRLRVTAEQELSEGNITQEEFDYNTKIISEELAKLREEREGIKKSKENAQ
jgi:hypothetical protein